MSNKDETAIVKVETKKAYIPFEVGTGILFRDFDGMQRFAAAAVAAGYWQDVNNVAKATMKLQMGAEVGLKPIQSLNRIHVIEGKPALAAEAMVGLVKNSGKYRLVEEHSNDELAVVVVYEKTGGEWSIVGRGSFSVEQASKAGLLSRHNWKSYTEDMLWARAVSRACRRHCADVVLGMYAVEDFDLREDDLHDIPAPNQAASILEKVNPPIIKATISNGALEEAAAAAQAITGASNTQTRRAVSVVKKEDKKSRSKKQVKKIEAKPPIPTEELTSQQVHQVSQEEIPF